MGKGYICFFTNVNELVNFLCSLPARSDIYFSFKGILYAIDQIVEDEEDEDVVIIKTKKEKESINTYSKEDIIEEVTQYLQKEFDVLALVEGERICVQNVNEFIQDVGSEIRYIIKLV